MKKHTNKSPRLKGAIAKLLAAMLIVVAVPPFITPPPVAHAIGKEVYGDFMYGKPYFADIGKDSLYCSSVKWANEHGAFGKKRGTEYHFRPLDDTLEGDFIQWTYKIYHKKITFGSKKYDKNAKRSWQWAQSIGIIGKNAHPNKLAIWNWDWMVLDRLANYIDGGAIDNAYSSRNPCIRATSIFHLYSFAELKSEGRYDPKNMTKI